MRFLTKSLALALPLSGALAAGPLVAQAQNAVNAVVAAPAARELKTRAQLEAQAISAEQQGRKSEAWLLRSRLKDGDFQEGDRIVVIIGNNPPRIDTMQVRAGNVLQFQSMADISLGGVLRSELSDTLRYHLSKYLVNPIVRTVPLLPIAVFGNVGLPGYYYFPADVLLRDLMMRVGVVRDADVKRAVVKRGDQTIWRSADISSALTDGLSLDRLHLRAGDEVFVPNRRGSKMTLIVGALTTSATVYMLFARGGRY